MWLVHHHQQQHNNHNHQHNNINNNHYHQHNNNNNNNHYQHYNNNNHHRQSSQLSLSSLLLPDTVCCENSIIWSNVPCDDPNPVLRTKAIAPWSGGIGILSIPWLDDDDSDDDDVEAIVESIVTKVQPENNTLTRLNPFISSLSPLLLSLLLTSSKCICDDVTESDSFICGTDSPVSVVVVVVKASSCRSSGSSNSRSKSRNQLKCYI